MAVIGTFFGPKIDELDVAKLDRQSIADTKKTKLSRLTDFLLSVESQQDQSEGQLRLKYWRY